VGATRVALATPFRFAFSGLTSLSDTPKPLRHKISHAARHVEACAKTIADHASHHSNGQPASQQARAHFLGG